MRPEVSSLSRGLLGLIQVRLREPGPSLSSRNLIQANLSTDAAHVHFEFNPLNGWTGIVPVNAV